MSLTNEERLKHFAAGVAIATVIQWCFRHWKGILIAFLVWKVLFFLWVHLFSPQTRDLSAEIDAARAKVSVVKVTNAKWQGSEIDAVAFRGDRKINSFDLEVKNDTPARIYAMRFMCEGVTVNIPPDSSYAPEIEKNSMRFPMLPQIIEPHSTTIVHVNRDQTMDSDLDKISCKVTSVSFIDDDFYRVAKEMDKWGLAGVRYRMKTVSLDRPSTYMGNSFPLHVTGAMLNVSKKTLVGYDVDCEAQRLDGGDDATQDYSTHFRTNLKPGDHQKIDLMIEDNFHSGKHAEAACRINTVVYE